MANYICFTDVVTASVLAQCIACLVELGSGIIASSLATLRPLIAMTFGSLTAKLSGSLPSFGFVPKRFVQPTPGNSPSATSGLRSTNSNHSFVQADKLLDKIHTPSEERLDPDSRMRDEVVFSPDSIYISFLADESDHEAAPYHGHLGVDGPIQDVEIAHVKGARTYHTWES